LSAAGTRTRPEASAVGRLTPVAKAPDERAGGTSGRSLGAIPGDADGEIAAAGAPLVDGGLAVGGAAGPGGTLASGDFAIDGGSVSRSVRAPEPAPAATWPR
jgi:hypothetical protein